MSRTVPVNLKKQNSDRAAIANAVDYALRVVGGFETWMRNLGPEERRASARPLEGLQVLEVGPGQTLGATVLLACAGARVSAADRFAAPWDPEFHAPFYRMLRDALPGSRPDLDPAPVERLLQAQGFARDVVRSFPFAAEELWKIDARFDVVFSNAVLEHVEDIEITAANLSAVTAARGYGFHQVDLRDHKDFSRPLEYLTMSSADYAEVRRQTFCERGCQWRRATIATALEQVGFTTLAFTNMVAPAEYLADVRPRLHAEFADLTDEDISAISVLYALQKF